MSSSRKKYSELIFSVLLVPLDALMLVLAGVSAYHLRFSELIQGVRPVFYNLAPQTFLLFTMSIIPLWLLIFALAGLYSQRSTRRLFAELSRVFVACSLGILLLIVIFFFQREFFSSRFIVIALWFLAVSYTSVARGLVRSLQHALLRLGIGSLRTLVIGNDETTTTILATLRGAPRLGFNVLARLETLPEPEALIREQLTDLLRRHRLDAVIITDPRSNHDQQASVLTFCQEHHLNFRYAADVFNAQATNTDVLPIGGIPVIEIKPTPLDGWGRIAKRLFDIIGALVCLLIFSPVMVLTAVVIVLDSGWPIFWRLDDNSAPRRIGTFGEPFRYFKFRSMYSGTHNQRYRKLAKHNARTDGPLVKIPRDPRITPVGRWIRAVSIDELPELFSVLVGDMSLVGPRPHLPEEVAKYPPQARKVLQIKPGMTGLAQISGRSDLAFAEEIRLDCYYIENWRLSLDILILLKTPLAILRRPIKA